MPSGWRLATVEDVARELSPEYAGRVNNAKRLRGLIARTKKAMGYREGAARGSERAAELRWWRMNGAQKTLHVTGLWHDKRLDQYDHNAKRTWRSHHRLAVRRGTFTGQLNVNERLAYVALEEIPPEAERALSERHHAAETARAALAATRETTRTREPSPDRTRERDLAFEL